MDHEGFGEFLSGECSPCEAQRIAEAIEAIESEYYPADAVAAWLANTGDTLSEWDAPTRESFEEAYAGEWDDLAAYAENLADDCGYLENDAAGRWPFTCINWEQAGRELDYGGDVWTADTPSGGIFVFNANV